MKIKAAFFLFFIFIFNTLVGFGCSLLMENEGNIHSHHHEALKLPASFIKLQITAPKDSCCKTLANDFLVQGKLLPDYTKLNLKTPAMVPVGYNFDFAPEAEIIVVDPQEINLHCHLSHPDIRTFIQSFQI